MNGNSYDYFDLLDLFLRDNDLVKMKKL